MNKFIISLKQNTTQNLNEDITNEQEIPQKELEDNETIQFNKIISKMNNVPIKIKRTSYIIN